MSGMGVRRGDEGWLTLFHGSGRSATGRAGEPPATEGVGCPKLPSKLNGELAVPVYDATLMADEHVRDQRRFPCDSALNSPA